MRELRCPVECTHPEKKEIVPSQLPAFDTTSFPSLICAVPLGSHTHRRETNLKPICRREVVIGEVKLAPSHIYILLAQLNMTTYRHEEQMALGWMSHDLHSVEVDTGCLRRQQLPRAKMSSSGVPKPSKIKDPTNRRITKSQGGYDNVFPYSVMWIYYMLRPPFSFSVTVKIKTTASFAKNQFQIELRFDKCCLEDR